MQALISRFGPEVVSLDPAKRAFFSQDVFRAGATCAAVIAPSSPEQVQEIVAELYRRTIPLCARGAGLSYTDAYLANSAQAVMLDLRALNKIEEINLEDAYVTAQAGVTWAALQQALRAHRVRTPFWGPLSGLHATLGGALSQSSAFLGSARFGAIGDSVLSIEAVVGEGEILKTGSAADSRCSPFMRYFGPDLSGLLIGDAGALGVKTRVTLKLIPCFAHSNFLSFQTPHFATLASAMSAIARSGLASECFAFDPALAAKRMQRASLAGDVSTLAQVVKKQGLLGGLKIISAGRNFLDLNQYSLHLTIEGHSHAELQANLQQLRALICPALQEIENSIPKVMSSMPFVAPNAILGPAGERWVPVHGIVPHSRALPCFEALHALYAQHAATIRANSVEIGHLCTTVGAQGFLIEPVFYWPDARAAFHEHIVEPALLAKLPVLEANPEARALVEQLKSACAQVLRAHGAVHFQLGKFYPYREARNASAAQLMDAVKSALDPKGLFNPGALAQ